MPKASPVLATHDSLLLVVDMQEKLLPAIQDADALRGRVARLAQAARLLSVPVWATEHWPGKIGATHPDLLAHVDRVVPKTHFDACRETDFLADWPAGRRRVLLTGTEAHICVLQTGLGLAQAGFQPVLVTDGIGSRRALDWSAACERWRYHGLETVTSEMAIYEWLETPSHPAFRAVLALVK
ncbi:MAG: isochorismatase family protein [Castellaniella sp.]|uniref:isochorismatase family protein n=1 Tax=Castellaniella sp. TaxID=1955812 RepID=UPI002A362346|nr:isochorismatase family protein [Castellaniella sp.]MDY0310242.1 isochorismatase family protein [Castellaniella sp.]